MKSFIIKIVAALALMVGAFGAPAAQAQVTRPTHTRTTTVESRSIDLAEAQSIFDVMASQPDIAFRYVADGCYARAHLMIKAMNAMGVQAVRVWAFATPGTSLHVKTKLMPGGYVEWVYHVAPAIYVNIGGVKVLMVIDPSLFSKPVTVEEWINRQKISMTGPGPIVQITVAGQGPVMPAHLASMWRHPEWAGRILGTGYQPGPDPFDLDRAARDKMAEYKAKEPPL